MSSAANGRGGQPEVIVSFVDGQSYSRTRLDEAFRAGFFDRPAPSKAAKETVNAKKEDVECIVRELELTKPEAERVLTEHGGDLQAALRTLVCANWGGSGSG